MTVVKTDDEFASVRPKALQGVRSARRKIPEIAGLHVANIGPSFRVEDSHATITVGHDRPLGGLVPVQLANSASGQPHIDARDLFRDGKIVNRYLTCPASVLDALCCVVERSPCRGHAAD